MNDIPQCVKDSKLANYADDTRVGNNIKVAVGPKRSTNRNLKKIISIECTKTVIFQLLWSLGISKLAKRELIN